MTDWILKALDKHRAGTLFGNAWSLQWQGQTWACGLRATLGAFAVVPPGETLDPTRYPVPGEEHRQKLLHLLELPREPLGRVRGADLRAWAEPLPPSCAVCDSTGMKPCLSCQGEGSTECLECGQDVDCKACLGHGVFPCTNCRHGGRRQHLLGRLGGLVIDRNLLAVLSERLGDCSVYRAELDPAHSVVIFDGGDRLVFLCDMLVPAGTNDAPELPLSHPHPQQADAPEMPLDSAAWEVSE